MNGFLSRLKKYITDASYYMGTSLIVALVGVLLNPIYAKNLSHEDYAILGYYASFNIFILPLLHFCLFSYYSRQYYILPESKRDRLGNTVLLSSIGLGFISFLLFTLLLYTYHRLSNVSFAFFPYAILTFLETYIYNVCTFYKTKLRIQRQAKRFALFSLSSCALTTAITLLLVVCLKEGATGKLMAALSSAFVFALYSFVKSLTKWELDRGLLIDALRFTWPLVVGTFLWYFISGIDKSILEKEHDTVTYGLYSVGFSISSYMAIFFTTISSTFLPDLYKSIAEKDHRKTMGIIVIIIGFVAFFNIIFIMLAPFVIDLLTAGRYIEAAPFARIFSVYNIFYALYVMMENVMIGYGFTKHLLVIKIIGSVLSVIFYFLLIGRWHFFGGAWSQSVSVVVLTIMMVIYILMNKNKLVCQH